jgi:hypothetical protein
MMSLSEILFLGVVLYLLYGFLFNFLLPIIKTTRQVRGQFRNMHESMNRDQASGNTAHGTAQSATGQSKKPDPPRSSSTIGEYIDFEEIK